MLDYLSLVKVIRWRFRLAYDEPLISELKFPENDLYRQLTWAFVGHRLGEVEELEIDVEDQERYLSNVAKMTRLRKVWIYRDKSTSYKDMYDFAKAMIKAIQLHHGPGQLSECHTIPDPIDLGSDEYNDNHSSREIDLSGASRVLSLLPPPRYYLTLPRPDGSTVSLNHLFDPYVATVEEIFSLDTENLSFMWKAMMKMYPGHSHAQILQRFRGLTILFISPKTANGDDENLLAWAACEAEHCYRQPGSHQPLVPLRCLQVKYEDNPYLFTKSPTAMATPKWKIHEDGLLGFSSTLRSLNVTYPQSDNGTIDRLFSIPRPLHKLRFLSLSGLAVDRSVWEKAPNIQHLQIDISIPLSRDSITIPSYSKDIQNTGTSSFPSLLIDSGSITSTTEEQPQRQLLEIWFHCPLLTDLALSDGALLLLDPKCHSSPNLKKPSIFAQPKTLGGKYSHQAQEVPRVIHPARLTWDWSFPVLRQLSLYGNLHWIGFSLAILRSCPTLRWIDLFHVDENHRFLLRVKRILDVPLNKDNNQMLPFTHINLLSIVLRGNWNIEVDELACLLQVLPGLKKIEFAPSCFNIGFGSKELVEVTKSHPS
ncbi:hypothetical protein BGW42_008354 [Actinomortierella wolfii]|nr:hypothetical protein BGW42_008354 [Actinomortierella wolfii]